MLLCCFAAAVIVSYIGLINFIGLVAPHIVRLVVGNNHVYLLPGSAIAGAVLLLLGDLVARVVISPVILPIGAITSFLGGAPVLVSPVQRGKKGMLTVERLSYHYKGGPARAGSGQLFCGGRPVYGDFGE